MWWCKRIHDCDDDRFDGLLFFVFNSLFQIFASMFQIWTFIGAVEIMEKTALSINLPASALFYARFFYYVVCHAWQVSIAWKERTPLHLGAGKSGPKGRR